MRQAMEIEGLDHEAAERRLTRVDRFRRAYVETVYGVDLKEPGMCHLVLRLDGDPARGLRRADRTPPRSARAGRSARAPSGGRRSRCARAAPPRAGRAPPRRGRARCPRRDRARARRQRSARSTSSEVVRRTVSVRPVARPIRDARFWPWRTLASAHSMPCSKYWPMTELSVKTSGEVAVARPTTVASTYSSFGPSVWPSSWARLIASDLPNQLSSSSRPLPRCSGVSACARRRRRRSATSERGTSRSTSCR